MMLGYLPKAAWRSLVFAGKREGERKFQKEERREKKRSSKKKGISSKNEHVLSNVTL